MDETLSAEEALRIAADTRRAAATPGLPAWLPAYAGITMALMMATLGISDTTLAGSAAQGLRFASVGLLIAHLAVYVELGRRWRRGGLVPRMDNQVRRRSSAVAVFLACAVGAGLSMSGQAGWGTACCGLILGAGTWFRLSGQVRQQ